MTAVGGSYKFQPRDPIFYQSSAAIEDIFVNYNAPDILFQGLSYIKTTPMSKRTSLETMPPTR